MLPTENSWQKLLGYSQVHRLKAVAPGKLSDTSIDMPQRTFEKKMARFPRSTIWDATTQRSIDVVRAFIHRHPQPTISQIQKASVKERPLSKSQASDSYHLVQDTLPASTQDDVRQMLFRTIAELGNVEYEEPALTPVPVEWVGSKTFESEDGKTFSSKRADLAKLTMDSLSDLTILHVHGGAFLYVAK